MSVTRNKSHANHRNASVIAKASEYDLHTVWAFVFFCFALFYSIFSKFCDSFIYLFFLGGGGRGLFYSILSYLYLYSPYVRVWPLKTKGYAVEEHNVQSNDEHSTTAFIQRGLLFVGWLLNVPATC